MIWSTFELYCMIYLVLDAEWDDTKDECLGQFLSEASPFTFADNGSADPAVYADFKRQITEPITLENSFVLAKRYIDSLRDTTILEAFSWIDESEWRECVSEYLAKEHKGGEARTISS